MGCVGWAEKGRGWDGQRAVLRHPAAAQLVFDCAWEEGGEGGADPDHDSPFHSTTALPVTPPPLLIK